MGFLITLLIFAALFLLSELLRPKPEMENAKPSGIGDFSFPTATEGRAVPLVWGTIRISGPNVVWYGNLRTVAITESVKTGLFSSSSVTVGFRYYVGIQFALCRGPVDQLRKVWVGDNVLFDRTGTPIVHDGTETFNRQWFFGGDDVGGNGGMGGTVLFKSGTDDQSGSAYLSLFQKINGDGLAYRGVCYVCPNSSPIYVGNSSSIQPWKFEIRRIPQGWSTATGSPGDGYPWAAYQLVNSNDANPALVLYEMLRNTEWGLGLTDEELDIPSLWQAALVCHGEGNGFSMILDQQQEMSNMIRTIEEQIDGVLVLDQITGLWTLQLIRPAGDLPLPQPTPKDIDKTNLVELVNFTRGAWEGTVNQLLLEFYDRSDDYKQTYAGAQDIGNIRVQDANVRSQIKYPGVKTADLANDLAWRELLLQSYPLAKATVKVDRTFWDSKIGDVIHLTDESLGITSFAMRVASVDLGSLAEGEVVMELVEDIFRAVAGAFDVPGSEWEDPSEDPAAFTYELAFEAPRAFSSRVYTSPEEPRIWATARRDGSETGFDIYSRTGGNPYAKTGDSVGFMVVGKLKAALTRSNTVPWSPAGSFVIKPDPDDLDLLYDSLTLSLSKNQVGTQLANLLLVGGELMFITGATKIGGELRIDTVYRGAIDTVQEPHAIDALCYILSAGGNLATVNWSNGQTVNTKLLAKTLNGVLDPDDATAINNFMSKKARRPYPPVWFNLGGVLLNYPATISLEQTGAADTFGIAFIVSRRDYLLTDEVAQMEADAATLATGFPAAEQHTTRVEVIKDYASTPVTLITYDEAVTSWTILENEILRYNAGAVPASLRFRIYARHVDAAETLDSEIAYVVDVPTITAPSLAGLFNMGADPAGLVSNVFTVATAGIHNLRISTVFANALQYRINGGAWLTLISAGTLNGNTSALVVADTIEFRHAETTPLIQKAYFRDPTVTDVAYWIPYV